MSRPELDPTPESADDLEAMRDSAQGANEERAMVRTDMRHPVRCKWCGTVHDGAKVTVEARYADCSCWRCPGCDVLIDDRPGAWGGSSIQLGEELEVGE